MKVIIMIQLKTFSLFFRHFRSTVRTITQNVESLPVNTVVAVSDADLHHVRLNLPVVENLLIPINILAFQLDF